MKWSLTCGLSCETYQLLIGLRDSHRSVVLIDGLHMNGVYQETAHENETLRSWLSLEHLLARKDVKVLINEN